MLEIETFEVAPDYVKHCDELGRMIKKIHRLQNNLKDNFDVGSTQKLMSTKIDSLS